MGDVKKCPHLQLSPDNCPYLNDVKAGKKVEFTGEMKSRCPYFLNEEGETCDKSLKHSGEGNCKGTKSCPYLKGSKSGVKQCEKSYTPEKDEL